MRIRNDFRNEITHKVRSAESLVPSRHCLFYRCGCTGDARVSQYLFDLSTFSFKLYLTMKSRSFPEPRFTSRSSLASTPPSPVDTETLGSKVASTAHLTSVAQSSARGLPIRSTTTSDDESPQNCQVLIVVVPGIIFFTALIFSSLVFGRHVRTPGGTC